MMDISLDKFYKYIFNVLQSTIPEEILGKITVAVSMNIDFLLNEWTNDGIPFESSAHNEEMNVHMLLIKDDV